MLPIAPARPRTPGKTRRAAAPRPGVSPSRPAADTPVAAGPGDTYRALAWQCSKLAEAVCAQRTIAARRGDTAALALLNALLANLNRQGRHYAGLARQARLEQAALRAAREKR